MAGYGASKSYNNYMNNFKMSDWATDYPNLFFISETVFYNLVETGKYKKNNYSGYKLRLTNDQLMMGVKMPNELKPIITEIRNLIDSVSNGNRLTDDDKELILEKLKNIGFTIRYVSLSDGIKLNNLVFYQSRRKAASYILFNIYTKGSDYNHNKRYVVDIPFDINELING